MDKAAERSGRGKILRRLAHALRPLGFARTKPTYFTRQRVELVEFFHLHKYTFAPSFRVHLGLRVENDPFSAPALNGIDSHAYTCKDPPGGRRYNLDYNLAPETLDRCAAELADWIRLVAEPWFERWRNPELLFDAPDSPLGPDERAALRAARERGSDPANVALSRSLLGLR